MQVIVAGMGAAMELDKDRIDDAALALLSLTLHDGNRVWKGLDSAIMDRLYEKGLIHDPANKAKALMLTDEGLTCAREQLTALFGQDAR